MIKTEKRFSKKTHKTNLDESLYHELYWLKRVLKKRLNELTKEGEPNLEDVDFQAKEELPLWYQSIFKNPTITCKERLVLILTLTPHLSPNLFDSSILLFVHSSGEYPQIGFTRGKSFRGFLPTGETAVFLLAGDDLEKRFEVEQLFSTDHWFYKKRVLWLETVPEGEPIMSGRIILNPELVEYFKTGKVTRPALSIDFPAQYIITELEWNDLVLPHSTMKQIDELHRWIKHNDKLMEDWGMSPKLKPGYRALFHGPPGTGKTLTASLLGKYTNRDVFRIDLSMVVSKYIGETEKNLSKLFAKAENKDWILFFDEADALFGKRTSVRDAHDKYANQEVSYLLQRIENYPGLTILASNFKSNIDDAFSRRFQSIVYFPFPEVHERKLLWEKAFPGNVTFSKDVDFSHLAKRFQLSGSNIMNIVQYVCLRALEDETECVLLEMIRDGIKREYDKEGKLM